MCTRLRFLVLIFLISPFLNFAQSVGPDQYYSLLKKETFLKHISVLASDSLEGRETAQPGMVKAANYVAHIFDSLGLTPPVSGSFFQQLPLMVKSSGITALVINGIQTEPGKDFYTDELKPNTSFTANELVFAGYGIIDSLNKWDDYNNTDVRNKIVVILDDEPKNKKGIPILSGEKGSQGKKDQKFKSDIARSKGAKAILYIKRSMNFNNYGMKKWVETGRMGLLDTLKGSDQPLVYISDSYANELLKLFGYTVSSFEKVSSRKKFKPVLVPVSIQISESADIRYCNNVLGYIEGTDKKDELIVITAHLDHLGKRNGKIYYGADDDGSGSSTVLTLAEAFSRAKKEGNGPRRSILFMTFSGEEKGLLGSEYYTDNPVFPLENTIADLNIDMIGRTDTITRQTTNYTYIIGSDRLSTELHVINENANDSCCKLLLDYRYNDPADKLKLYSRSDHYNFAKNNIPVIFYFTGLHEDYHKPTDTVDKIEFEKMTVIAKLVFSTAWELANRDTRPVLNAGN